MEKFTLYEEENNKLMNIYNNIIKDKKESYYNINNNMGIKIGDFVVFNSNGQDLNGEVIKISKENYLVRGNHGGKMKQDIFVSFDQINEHYPKNSEFKESKMENPDLKSTTLKNVNYHTNKIKKEEKIIEEDYLQPLDENNEIVIIFPEGMKQKEIEKLLPNYNNAKYFMVEKNKELHVVKIKEGFELKPFIEGIINHMLKNKTIKENISQMKVVGNGNFCIIKNPPKKVNEMLKKSLKYLLK